MEIFNFDLAKARFYKQSLFLLSFLIGVLGPIILISTKFDLYVATESDSKLHVTFVGILVIISVISYFTKEIIAYMENWEAGVARTILLSMFEVKEWMLLFAVFMFFRSEWFNTRITDWYLVTGASMGLAFLGRVIKRGSEYWGQYIKDRKLYTKFKKWDTQEG